MFTTILAPWSSRIGSLLIGRLGKFSWFEGLSVQTRAPDGRRSRYERRLMGIENALPVCVLARITSDSETWGAITFGRAGPPRKRARCRLSRRRTRSIFTEDHLSSAAIR